MKNLLKFTSVLLVIALIVVSCSKDELSTNVENVENQEINDYLKLSDEEFKSILQNFTNEYAKFNSEREFHAFTTYFYNLEGSEQESILNGLSYTTLDEKLSEAYDGMNALETEQQFYNYVSNYSDILEIQVMDNGEKEVAEKEISLHSIASFLNADRIVKVGDDYKKFIGSIAVISSTYSELLSINETHKIKAHTNFEEVYYIPNNGLKTVAIDAPLVWSAENGKRCKRRREVYFASDLIVESVTSEYVPPIYKVFCRSRVEARRKGIPCFWYKYNTDITWNNFRIVYEINGGAFVRAWNHSDQTANNVKKIVRTSTTWFSATVPTDVSWNRVRSTVTTSDLAQSIVVDQVF